ncbi:MAG TPA: DNA ligase D [Chitinophagaceae bacterium]|nr:DNA ligase D [Chitinophagaceae bacterium]
MSLTTYKKKRSFKKTPEPVGGKSRKNDLRFVVQKHDASHLHYDFRLEMQGVLKSWAVPKGPSMDPAVKHLAMMVEDHPYDYRTFEGIIPPGNYGAGTVIVWDEGTYEADKNIDDKKQQEKYLLHQLYSGKLKFILHGKKLKGEFALVKTPARGENAWLLMKLKDKYATTKDIGKKDTSVVSNKTIEQIARSSRNIWESNRSKVKNAKTSRRERVIEKKAGEREENVESSERINTGINSLLQKATKAPFPSNIKPMLATLTDKPFDNDDFIYEIKWDGYRAVSYLHKGKVDIRSRNKLSFNKKFPHIVEVLQQWKTDAVVDGEIIAINDEGRADFQQLQGFIKNANAAHLVYYVFDIIWYNGKDVTRLPLIERKAILQSIMPEDQSIIRYSDHIAKEGNAFFKAAIKQGLEGIMAKRADSEYAIGYRSQNWLKIKNNQQTEAIICGFTQPRRSRKYFGAIILGKYIKGELAYIGHSGSGINQKTLKELYEKFQPLITNECPFKKKPVTNMPATWLKPKLVCEIKFSEWTGEKILRIPIFLGLREDKEAKNEKEEKIISAPAKKEKLKPVKKNAMAKAKKIIEAETTVTSKSTPGKSKKTTVAVKASSKKIMANKPLLQEKTKEETLTIKNHEQKFTNLDKIYFPKEKITKREILNYYYQVAPYIMPYMKDRPQSLNRHPNGINGPSFYQKNVEGKVASWIETHPYTSESDGITKQFLVCKDEDTLMYLANLGCIEMNPWHSRIQSPDQPDWCVIDLDPDDNPYDQVIEAAQAVKKLLDAIDVECYCKTSGATGMHIYIPLGAKYSYDQSRMLAELIVTIVHRDIESFTSIERSPSKRKKKIYLDFLQNRSIQTIAAPYSLRPKPDATVSAPLRWEEVKTGLSPKNFTIHNILDRIKTEGDIFSPVSGKGINLEQALKKLNQYI